ncbi:hypothetical protein D0A34_21245 [Microcoleus vaginatus PCC 9802]|uniref:hypothetical protein n=1 Tax=Microcoleus vaginatus TaxID=119532 RepID=UPI000586A246|nr:hypothetical protein D0A34_21245 [Microcoleus vaginatus PCC 9802]
MPSLFQQCSQQYAFMFMQAIGSKIGRTYLNQAHTMSKSVNKPFKQDLHSITRVQQCHSSVTVAPAVHQQPQLDYPLPVAGVL